MLDQQLWSTVSMFSGIGGLDLAMLGLQAQIRSSGVRPGFGFDFGSEHESVRFTESVLWVESNEHCQSVIRRRMEDGCLVPAPILEDASAIAEFCQTNGLQADGVTGGFPCQGTSSAGQRQGLKDPRTKLVSYLFSCFDSVNALEPWSVSLSNSAHDDYGVVLVSLQVVHDTGECEGPIVKVNGECHGLSAESHWHAS